MKKTFSNILTLSFLVFFISIFTACNMEKTTNFDQKALPEADEITATIFTNFGDMQVRLFKNEAPETVKNFIELTNQGKYQNVAIHRIVPDFVIQGGDFEKGNGTGGYSYKGIGTKIDNEINPHLSHIRGALSMANAGPNTNGSQFFIVIPETNAVFLDGDYSIFGQVYQGIEVVDSIAKIETDVNDAPLQSVLIEKIEINNK